MNGKLDPLLALSPLVARFNAAIEAVARRSYEIGETEWYTSAGLEGMHSISGADAALIALCSPANIHVLCHYASSRPANAREGELIALLKECLPALDSWKRDGERRFTDGNGTFHLILGGNHYRAMMLMDRVHAAITPLAPGSDGGL